MIHLLVKTRELAFFLWWDREKERGCDCSQLIGVEEVKRKVDFRNGDDRIDDLDK